jgi:hypothetical protein
MGRVLNVWREVETVDGYRGSYCCYRGHIYVTAGGRRKMTHLGAMPPKVLARIMLRELAEEEEV